MRRTKCKRKLNSPGNIPHQHPSHQCPRASSLLRDVLRGHHFLHRCNGGQNDDRHGVQRECDGTLARDGHNARDSCADAHPRDEKCEPRGDNEACGDGHDGRGASDCCPNETFRRVRP